ncbi:MAG: 16S rRNA (cytosine(1402)-N(4))-methyltransferase RsmH [Vicinamibacterales bacterium]
MSTRARRTTNRRQRFPRGSGGGAPVEVVHATSTGSPHTPIMLAEVLRCLQPRPGDVVVDATLGGGGHAQALLSRIAPAGTLLGLDVDGVALDRTANRLRQLDLGARLVTRHASFAYLPDVLREAGLPPANAILVDLGVSSMQMDDPARGLYYKAVGPLDLRLDLTRGEPASAWLARQDQASLSRVLREHADEPHADLIAARLVETRVTTTHALERVVRTSLMQALPDLALAEAKLSVRRSLQALRIAVNDEFTALERLLDALPRCLAPGGRVAVLTFHSGEDRRVKHAFREGRRAGVYSAAAREVIRSTMDETRANRRASSAKLRWAIRATPA